MEGQPSYVVRRRRKPAPITAEEEELVRGKRKARNHSTEYVNIRRAVLLLRRKDEQAARTASNLAMRREADAACARARAAGAAALEQRRERELEDSRRARRELEERCDGLEERNTKLENDYAEVTALLRAAADALRPDDVDRAHERPVEATDADLTDDGIRVADAYGEPRGARRRELPGDYVAFLEVVGQARVARRADPRRRRGPGAPRGVDITRRSRSETVGISTPASSSSTASTGRRAGRIESGRDDAAATPWRRRGNASIAA